MRTKTDRMTEHYLIPILLFFSSIFLVAGIFYWNEWLNVYSENYLSPFYPLRDLGGRRDFLAATSIHALCYLTIAMVSIGSIALKNKILCVFSISLSLIGFFLLFY
ncbi:hypothetical protein Cycma_4174 [Cyclobacterium marinum DSM 745]|uniref:Uncharacterized protein n=1 Tax=Cyclobacterium marinum (strain ATCC 25205 / DSM 745 / LMG 13164 / NCIMB 1802) TaxID=880070 RepID=G0J898_CYCMS|nr:hypothetical protein Cycma_4174 [Cyclobacterium marinum DSM 745]|tara:strand:+ start:180733 stop:181050 length:318 start_codon:yes stop_codon:yes gene_type:complete